MAWRYCVIFLCSISLPAVAAFDVTIDPEVHLSDAALIEREIAALETDLGPFHPEVGERLTALGRHYLAQENVEQALKSFDRSLDILRRQHGLYSEQHIPVIQQKINALRQLGRWQAVDNYYDYLYWVCRRFYGNSSPELLPVLNALILWKVEAVNARVISNQKVLLSNALKAARAANDIIAAHPHLSEKDAPVISEEALKQAMRIIQDSEQSLLVR